MILSKIITALTFLFSLQAHAQSQISYSDPIEDLCKNVGVIVKGCMHYESAASLEARNSCLFSYDGVCNDAEFGGDGKCDSYSDMNDCIGNVVENDTCPFAKDDSCDEARFGGSGACFKGTDTSDCYEKVQAGSNTCENAYDGICDEVQSNGSSICEFGTDSNDCRGSNQDQNNSCVYARDNVCDEAEKGGTGSCRVGTDSDDCLQFPQNSCATANNGTCEDQTRVANGTCAMGTDHNDCKDLAVLPNNSCATANDLICDEYFRYEFIPGICKRGTDANDCKVEKLGAEDIIKSPSYNTCQFAYDGECDEPDACRTGTDLADCRTVPKKLVETNRGERLDFSFKQKASPELQKKIGEALNSDNTCRYARDGECDEPYTCERGTDSFDCRNKESKKPIRISREDFAAFSHFTQVPFAHPSLNQCTQAKNGVCEDRSYVGVEDTACDSRGKFKSDEYDCFGKDRRSPGQNDIARENSCKSAFNSLCEDRRYAVHTGNGCESGTDEHDCRMSNTEMPETQIEKDDDVDVSEGQTSDISDFYRRLRMLLSTIEIKKDGPKTKSRVLKNYMDNSCYLANNNICEDASFPNHQRNLCPPLTDISDCLVHNPERVSVLSQFASPEINTCRFALDGSCDDSYYRHAKTSGCEQGTDELDCFATTNESSGRRN